MDVTARLYYDTGRGVVITFEHGRALFPPETAAREDSMKNTSTDPVILMVDDDPDDHLLVREALSENGRPANLLQLMDGKDLMSYLRGCDGRTGSSGSPRPDLILLDLNMPGKDGRETLRELKACTEADFRGIPVVVLTTSRDSGDVQACYNLGASSFIEKPSGFEQLVDIMRVLSSYWFDVARLPGAMHA
jgi:CheY-like chemotaxis protein